MVNSVCAGTLLCSPSGAVLYLSDVVIYSFCLKAMILWLCLSALLLHCVLSVAMQFHSDAVVSPFCLKVMILLLDLSAQLLFFVLQVMLCYHILMLCFISCNDFVVNSVCTGTLLCSPNGAVLHISDVAVSSFSLKVMNLLLVLCALLLCFVLQVTLCCIFLMLSFLKFV